MFEMSDSEQPQEPDQALYQRDKTAKDPRPSKSDVQVKTKPKPKVRKAFVPKKLVKKTDKPQEYRVRHIRVSTLESVNIFHKAIVDFQKELACEPVDDPDKPFHDQGKVENYFIRIAKKYSTCSTRALGGDLGWIYKGMKAQEELVRQIIASYNANTTQKSIADRFRLTGWSQLVHKKKEGKQF